MGYREQHSHDISLKISFFEETLWFNLIFTYLELGDILDKAGKGYDEILFMKKSNKKLLIFRFKNTKERCSAEK